MVKERDGEEACPRIYRDRYQHPPGAEGVFHVVAAAHMLPNQTYDGTDAVGEACTCLLSLDYDEDVMAEVEEAIDYSGTPFWKNVSGQLRKHARLLGATFGRRRASSIVSSSSVTVVSGPQRYWPVPQARPYSPPSLSDLASQANDVLQQLYDFAEERYAHRERKLRRVFADSPLGSEGLSEEQGGRARIEFARAWKEWEMLLAQVDCMQRLQAAVSAVYVISEENTTGLVVGQLSAAAKQLEGVAMYAHGMSQGLSRECQRLLLDCQSVVRGLVKNQPTDTPAE